MRKLKNNELGRITIDEFKSTKKTPLIVVLDNVRSLNNIGSVFRTSDAFLVEKIYLCGICATPPNRDIHKTALGATESVDWEYVENTLSVVEKLKKESVKVLAIEQAENSTKLDTFFPEKDQKYAIVMGNEVNGISTSIEELVTKRIAIPRFGITQATESLNVATATAICLSEFKRG